MEIFVVSNHARESFLRRTSLLGRNKIFNRDHIVHTLLFKFSEIGRIKTYSKEFGTH